MIVYKGRDEDYDVSFWFYDQNIRVDWGDGIIEDFVNSKAGLDRVNHKIEDNHIIVIVNSNTFQCGILRVTRAFNTPDSDFNDGIWDYGDKTEYTNIEIVS